MKIVDLLVRIGFLFSWVSMCYCKEALVPDSFK